MKSSLTLLPADKQEQILQITDIKKVAKPEKIIPFFLCFLCLTNPSFSQTEIRLDSVSKHIGDNVIVCGQVNDAYYACFDK